ncbi:MAG: hypothetical protein AABY95_07065 [Pseudomonadota bacterium]
MSRISLVADAGLCSRVVAAIVAIFVGGYSAQGLAQTDAQRIQAATTTANTNAFCNALPKFYWEIGKGSQSTPMASGSRGGGAPSATTQMPVYSASKWVYGAYVFQKRSGVLSTADRRAATMSMGYTENSACLFDTTVGTCHTAMDAYDPAALDKFFYASGHFQKHASVDLALSAMNKTQLATEIHSQVGSDFVFTYNQPQLAGRGKSSATDYAKFLRKILNGQLLLSGSALGSDAVCTYTDPTDPLTGRTNCPTALYSPVDDAAVGLQEAWHYSIGHWVEDDPVWLANGGDAAYSSPGAAGFYPWIDSSRTYYGILARNEVGATSSGESVKCGRLIRKAWLTATAQ